MESYEQQASPGKQRKGSEGRNHKRKLSLGNSQKRNKSKQYSPYQMPDAIETKTPARIRISAAVRNQPQRNSALSQHTTKSKEESERLPNNMPHVSSMEKLEPYLKKTAPIKPLKNFVSTVSYLRPATESKTIVPSQTTIIDQGSKTIKHGKPQRLQSAGTTMQGNYAHNRHKKQRLVSNYKTGQPSAAQVPNHLAKVTSGQTRATNISSNEKLSPVMNNITNKGLQIVFPDNDKAHNIKEASQITFQSLQEGDVFDRDIKRIMSIINGVEKQFSEKKITNDFQSALHNAYQRRVLQVDHDQLVSKTILQSSASQNRKRGSRFVMPDTYASVVGNLNQQSGDLNLHSSAGKVQSSKNLPLSPKSHQATQLNKARRQKMSNNGSNPAALFDQQSNQDLNVTSGYLSSTQSGMNPKIIRRRPQTTKRLCSYQKQSYNNSNLGLKQDPSILTSIEQENIQNITYNEEALLKTQQNMLDSSIKRASNDGHDLLPQISESNYGLPTATIPRTIGTAEDGRRRTVQKYQSDSDMDQVGMLDLGMQRHMSNGLNNGSLSGMESGCQVTNPNKVLMQINKYVHPCERLPPFIKQEDLKAMALDYELKENERIRDHMISFDELFTQTLCGTQDGRITRIKRYNEQYLPESGCDSSLEDKLSYIMFIDDIKDIRNMVKTFLHDTLSGQLTAEKKFAKEREFFSDQVSNVKEANALLQQTIEKLTKDLDTEKNYNLQLFVDEQVTQMCQRAYFSFNLMSKETTIKAYQNDDEIKDQQALNLSSRKQPIAVTSDSQKPKQMQARVNNDSQASILDSILDGSVHVGNKDQMQDGSLTKLSKLVEGAGPSDEEMQVFRSAIDDLKWKLDYEKNIHKEIVQLLEKKVAGYLVQINTFQENELEQKAKIESQEQQIEAMQTKIKDLCNQLSQQTIANEKLQFKVIEVSENVVGMTKFETLQSDLNIAQTQIKYKNGKIENQQLEIEQLLLIIKELYQKVSQSVQITERKFTQLESFVDGSIVKMNKKLKTVLNLFQDTLLYSNKTYYQEEMYKRERTIKKQTDRITQLEKKQKLLSQGRKLKQLQEDCEKIDSEEQTENQRLLSTTERLREEKLAFIENLQNQTLVNESNDQSYRVSTNNQNQRSAVVETLSADEKPNNNKFFSVDGLKEPSFSASEGLGDDGDPGNNNAVSPLTNQDLVASNKTFASQNSLAEKLSSHIMGKAIVSFGLKVQQHKDDTENSDEDSQKSVRYAKAKKQSETAVDQHAVLAVYSEDSEEQPR